jgi:hypothetical protein
VRLMKESCHIHMARLSHASPLGVTRPPRDTRPFFFLLSLFLSFFLFLSHRGGGSIGDFLFLSSN